MIGIIKRKRCLTPFPFTEKIIYGKADDKDIYNGINKDKDAEHINDKIENCRILDLDQIFLSLGETNSARFQNYEKFIGENIPLEEINFLRDSVKRGQLTGNFLFEEAVQRIIGVRIERRSQGRPFKNK
ncbi:MAG: hypothetical protein EVJ46_01020 [Candidatus Acididesulfobacter guangdongensis]|uniref:Uncharacterized protein n=1 Tax=Acididesulfobacter guangdongensis TaxID=2597225 RepID=A0A519BHW5_ACIG2|nr:MAG: hypothetical protein EVJ46_01020 [Candidatus Acididesulfobacter guangdongensis]